MPACSADAATTDADRQAWADVVAQLAKFRLWGQAGLDPQPEGQRVSADQIAGGLDDEISARAREVRERGPHAQRQVGAAFDDVVPSR